MNRYKTGKRPARHGAIRHKFKTFFDASELPTPPVVFGRTSYFPEDGWGILYNDQAGCCVFSGGAHETMLWGALGGRGATTFTDEQIISDYSAVTGYDQRQTDANGDNPTDQGTDMVAAAHYRQTKGLLDAHPPRKPSAIPERLEADQPANSRARWQQMRELRRRELQHPRRIKDCPDRRASRPPAGKLRR